MKDRIDPGGLQLGVTSIVAFDEVVCLSTLDWVNKDRIGVMIVEEKDVVHATCGGEGKTSRLVRGDHDVEIVKFNSRGAD